MRLVIQNDSHYDSRTSIENTFEVTGRESLCGESWQVQFVQQIYLFT